LKKRLLSVVCIALVLTFNAVPALAAGAGFSDVPSSHTFYSGIMDCAGKGITSGYDGGTFRPANPVTRAQFCVMLSRAFYSDQIEAYNTDLYKKNWFGPNAKALSVAGVLKNTSMEYNFGEASKMNQNISRYDMAQLMTNIMSSNGSAASDSQKASVQGKITDYSSIPAKYQNAVKNVYALGIITGYADGAFNGDANMNRGQGCIVIYRMLQFVPGNMGNNTGSTENPAPAPDTPKTEQPTTQTTGTLTNGKPITEENVLEIIQELLVKYPDGMKWDDNTYRKGTASKAMQSTTTGQTTSNGLTPSVQGGCGGFASLISDSIFGSGDANPARKVPITTVRPGDVIIKLDKNGNYMHYATAASKITGTDIWGDKISPVITSYEGNYSEQIVYTDYREIPATYSEYHGCYWECWTRYPTDGTPWTQNNTSDAPYVKDTNNDSSTTQSSPAPSESVSLTAATAAAHAHSDMLCAVCGTVIWDAGANGPNSNMSGWDDTRDIGVCNNCWLTPEGQKAFYGR